MPRGTQVPAVSLPGSGTGLSPALAEFSNSLPLPTWDSRLPVLQPRPNESGRFGLFPLRSPLLRESRLISFPSGTEMFHFPELASSDLCIYPMMTEHDFRRVAPFRHPRIKGCLAPPRGLSQLTTSFLAFRRQGIHLMLFSCLLEKTSFHPSAIFNEPALPGLPSSRLVRIHISVCACFQTWPGRIEIYAILRWWAWIDLNYRPHAYQACALTT